MARRSAAVGKLGSGLCGRDRSEGVGKSCLIETATNHFAGVVTVLVPPGASTAALQESVMREITNMRLRFQDVEPSFRRVIFWHRVLTLESSPVVILNLGECRLENNLSEITAAVRDFAQLNSLRVIIDASPNSVDSHTLDTGRCLRLDVDFMDVATIESIGDFAEIREWLTEADLYLLALEFLGGVPNAWRSDDKVCRTSLPARSLGLNGVKEASSKRRVLEREIMRLYIAAEVEIKKARTIDAHLDEITRLYLKKNERLSTYIVARNGLRRHNPDKIFREREGFVEPATRLLRCVLKYGIDKNYNIEDIKGFAAAEQSSLKDKLAK